MTSALAPIALFAYNRPRHLAEAVSALLRDPLAAASDLHVFCDGPKSPSAAPAVGEVRRFVRSISGFRSISIVEQEGNIGLANSIIAGVTTLSERFGRVIVVEDDLIVAPCFLRFMNEGLARYEGDDQVMQIAGYMFPIGPRFGKSAIFLPFPSSWGWASWRRAWRYFDPSMSGYVSLRQSKWLRHQFDLDGAYPYFDMLEHQIDGRIDSWAIRWHLSCFVRRGLTLYPGATIVRNIGSDGSGTHAGIERDPMIASLPPAGAEFSLPAEIRVDDLAYADVKRTLMKAQPSNRLVERIARLWR